MHIIMGATGHVGSALASALLERGEPVTLVVRDPKKAEALVARGGRVAVAEVRDTAALRQIFRQGQRLFVLNPPGAPDGDLEAEERASVRAILSALEGAGLQKVVAASTYGAQPGTRIGDLGVLHELEQALSCMAIPTSVMRGAYYMSNWDMQLAAIRQTSRLESLYPVDFALPMVAPRDLGEAAARLMIEPLDQTRLTHVEGPARYTLRDVASAFSRALKIEVTPVEVPRERWTSWLRGLGFSEAAAASFVGMTERTLEASGPARSETERGTTTLSAYVDQLVRS